MSSEHAREVLKDVALDTAGELKRSRVAVIGGIAVGLTAMFAVLLLFILMSAAPSRVDLVPRPKPFPEASR
jgi:hypothetical protein